MFYQIQVYKLTTQRLARHRTQILNLTSKQLVFSIGRLACHGIYVIESTTGRLPCHKIRVVDLTSNQLMCPGEQVMCYRIQVLESTSNQLMCSIDRLTYHRTRVINLTSNQLICQKPLPCTLTFKVSSIKH
mgnify:CR=1 FL=1